MIRLTDTKVHINAVRIWILTPYENEVYDTDGGRISGSTERLLILLFDGLCNVEKVWCS